MVVLVSSNTGDFVMIVQVEKKEQNAHGIHGVGTSSYKNFPQNTIIIIAHQTNKTLGCSLELWTT